MMNKKLKEILSKVTKTFKTSGHIKLDVVFALKKDNVVMDCRLYISNHTFKTTNSGFSNYCDSIEGLIEHLNYEFKDVPNWKPITQTVKGKRELANFKTITNDTRYT